MGLQRVKWSEYERAWRDGPGELRSIKLQIKKERWKGGCCWGLEEKRKLFNLTKLRTWEAHSTRGSEPKQPLLSQGSPKWLPPCYAIPKERKTRRRSKRRGFSCNSLLERLSALTNFWEAEWGGRTGTQRLKYVHWDTRQYRPSINACVHDCGAAGNWPTICVLFTPQFGRTANSSEAKVGGGGGGGGGILVNSEGKSSFWHISPFSPPTPLKKHRKQKAEETNAAFIWAETTMLPPFRSCGTKWLVDCIKQYIEVKAGRCWPG